MSGVGSQGEAELVSAGVVEMDDSGGVPLESVADEEAQVAPRVDSAKTTAGQRMGLGSSRHEHTFKAGALVRKHLVPMARSDVTNLVPDSVDMITDRVQSRVFTVMVVVWAFVVASHLTLSQDLLLTPTTGSATPAEVELLCQVWERPSDEATSLLLANTNSLVSSLSDLAGTCIEAEGGFVQVPLTSLPCNKKYTLRSGAADQNDDPLPAVILLNDKREPISDTYTVTLSLTPLAAGAAPVPDSALSGNSVTSDEFGVARFSELAVGPVPTGTYTMSTTIEYTDESTGAAATLTTMDLGEVIIMENRNRAGVATIVSTSPPDTVEVGESFVITLQVISPSGAQSSFAADYIFVATVEESLDAILSDDTVRAVTDSDGYANFTLSFVSAIPGTYNLGFYTSDVNLYLTDQSITVTNPVAAVTWSANVAADIGSSFVIVEAGAEIIVTGMAVDSQGTGVPNKKLNVQITPQDTNFLAIYRPSVEYVDRGATGPDGQTQFSFRLTNLLSGAYDVVFSVEGITAAEVLELSVLNYEDANFYQFLFVIGAGSFYEVSALLFFFGVPLLFPFNWLRAISTTVGTAVRVLPVRVVFYTVGLIFFYMTLFQFSYFYSGEFFTNGQVLSDETSLQLSHAFESTSAFAGSTPFRIVTLVALCLMLAALLASCAHVTTARLLALWRPGHWLARSFDSKRSRSYTQYCTMLYREKREVKVHEYNEDKYVVKSGAKHSLKTAWATIQRRAVYTFQKKRLGLQRWWYTTRREWYGFYIPQRLMICMILSIWLMTMVAFSIEILVEYLSIWSLQAFRYYTRFSTQAGYEEDGWQTETRFSCQSYPYVLFWGLVVSWFDANVWDSRSITNDIPNWVPRYVSLGVWLAYIFMLLSWMHMMLVYKTRLMNMRKGKFFTNRKMFRMTFIIRYVGFQATSTVIGFWTVALAIVSIIFMILALIYVQYLALIILYLLYQFLIYFVGTSAFLTLVGRFIIEKAFYSKANHDFRHKRLFYIIDYFSLVLNFVGGWFVIILRTINNILYIIAVFWRLDITLLPKSIAFRDMGYEPYVAMMMVHHDYGNPIVHTFLGLLAGEAKARRQRREDELKEKEEKLRMSMGEGVSEAMRDEVIRQVHNLRLQQEQKELASVRARTKWHLALTLINNPRLVHDRANRFVGSMNQIKKLQPVRQGNILVDESRHNLYKRLTQDYDHRECWAAIHDSRLYLFDLMNTAVPYRIFLLNSGYEVVPKSRNKLGCPFEIRFSYRTVRLISPTLADRQAWLDVLRSSSLNQYETRDTAQERWQRGITQVRGMVNAARLVGATGEGGSSPMLKAGGRMSITDLRDIAKRRISSGQALTYSMSPSEDLDPDTTLTEGDVEDGSYSEVQFESSQRALLASRLSDDALVAPDTAGDYGRQRSYKVTSIGTEGRLEGLSSEWNQFSGEVGPGRIDVEASPSAASLKASSFYSQMAAGGDESCDDDEPVTLGHILQEYSHSVRKTDSMLSDGRLRVSQVLAAENLVERTVGTAAVAFFLCKKINSFRLRQGRLLSASAKQRAMDITNRIVHIAEECVSALQNDDGAGAEDAIGELRSYTSDEVYPFLAGTLAPEVRAARVLYSIPRPFLETTLAPRIRMYLIMSTALRVSPQLRSRWTAFLQGLAIRTPYTTPDFLGALCRFEKCLAAHIQLQTAELWINAVFVPLCTGDPAPRDFVNRSAASSHALSAVARLHSLVDATPKVAPLFIKLLPLSDRLAQYQAMFKVANRLSPAGFWEALEAFRAADFVEDDVFGRLATLHFLRRSLETLGVLIAQNNRGVPMSADFELNSVSVNLIHFIKRMTMVDSFKRMFAGWLAAAGFDKDQRGSGAQDQIIASFFDHAAKALQSFGRSSVSKRSDLFDPSLVFVGSGFPWCDDAGRIICTTKDVITLMHTSAIALVDSAFAHELKGSGSPEGWLPHCIKALFNATSAAARTSACLSVCRRAIRPVFKGVIRGEVTMVCRHQPRDGPGAGLTLVVDGDVGTGEVTASARSIAHGIDGDSEFRQAFETALMGRTARPGGVRKPWRSQNGMLQWRWSDGRGEGVSVKGIVDVCVDVWAALTTHPHG